MRNLVYNVRYSAVPINSWLLTVTLYFSVITTLVYNDTKYSVRFMMIKKSSNVFAEKKLTDA
jgi:hypothetical protein